MAEEKLREYLRRVTLDLRKARRELRELKRAEHEPIAIIGMGCRYPGGVSCAEELWRVLEQGIDAIGEFPEDRGWRLEALHNLDPAQAGSSYVCEGGFLLDATEFDAAFFGISPREALAMDPQQRLVLETCWEACEDAGVSPDSLGGSPTGVFLGIASLRYGGDDCDLVEELEGHRLTGVVSSVASGRVSYVLGLKGPAISIDTACSSSLVALHLASQALRRGECSLALAGGVSVMAGPEVFVEFARQRALAPDGRCKAFADGADGTGWGEGSGVLLLERLCDAQRLGHRVLAVMRGSALNQDGRSNGLTAPSGLSQQRVIGDALRDAGLSADEIDAVEGHGTGTALGDPIEVEALLASYGSRRSAQPLWLGSLKSNIGHTQAASGVAGVIKMVMAMRHEVLPRTLHVDEPSRQVDWSTGAVSLLTEAQPWAQGDRPRRAGISAFGMSGTNAHVIVEQAPVSGSPVASDAETVEPDTEKVEREVSEKVESDVSEKVEPCSGRQRTPKDRSAADWTSAVQSTSEPAFEQIFDTARADAIEARLMPWPLSGRGASALRAQARKLHDHLQLHPELGGLEISLALARRPAFEDRVVVLGDSREQLLAGMERAARGEADSAVLNGLADEESAHGLVWAFPGQGMQWPGMAAQLLECSPVFGRSVRECQDALSEFVDWSLEDVLCARTDPAALERVDVLQPTLFAVMVSLAQLWRACGVLPSAVVGHSQGEIAAAHVAGILSLRDAARVVTARSRALLAVAGRGGMVSLAVSGEDAERLIGPYGGKASIAAVNGPSSIVVSGDEDALGRLLRACESEQIKAKRIAVDYAAHSPQVESLRDQLLASCEQISPLAGEIPFYSTVTGQRLDGSQLDAEYWYRNLRETVSFQQATEALLEEGLRSFVEVSPAPALAAGILQSAERLFDRGGVAPRHSLADVQVFASLRRGEGGPRRFVTSLSQAWVAGVNVDWRAFLADGDVALPRLPTYAFQRQRYWLEPGVGGRAVKDQASDGGFWEAVEGEDANALVDVLGVEDDLQRSSLEAVLPALSAWHHRRREQSLTDAWRYRVVWKRVSGSRPALSGSWAVVLPSALEEDEWVRSVLGILASQTSKLLCIGVDEKAMGDRALLADRLRAALSTPREDAVLSPPVAESEQARVAVRQPPAATVGESSPPVPADIDGVFSLLALAEDRHSECEAVPLGLAGTLALAQALADLDVGAALWLATRGAVSVKASERLESPTQATAWGLGRVIALERPQRRCGLVDISGALDDTTARSLCTVLAGVGEEDQLAVRHGEVFARRLVRAGAARSTERWKPAGTALITGGTGALGAHVARWLAREGAPRLILVSRSGPAAQGALELQRELEGSGAQVQLVACDVADREQLAALLTSLPAEHPLDSVIHAAGVGGEGEPVEQLTVERLQALLAPKALAALNLHELTKHMQLSAFVLFSSFAATMGSGGQGHYAAANAFLDALAEHRRTAGLPATSLAWGLWAGAGMGASAVGELSRRGILPMPPQQAIGLLGAALDRRESCLTLTRVDWDRYAPAYAFGRPRPLIEDLDEVRAVLSSSRSQARTGGGILAERLAELPERERERVVLELVRTEAAAALGHTGLDAIDPQRAFRDLGFDSLIALELRNRLQTSTGLPLQPTVAFDHPTASRLAGHIQREALGRAADPVAGSAPTPTQEPVAIVAMSCRYPGGVRSPEELWELVRSGVDAISPFPRDRGWDLEGLYDPDPDRAGRSYTREGGFVSDVGEFDAGFFGIAPSEALAMDPQQRILLEACWEAVERGGIDPSSLRDSCTGTFIGINPSSYGLDLPEELEGYRVTAGAGSVLSGRVAYTLGLLGPAVSVDTACSSSLVALHLACSALRAGECDMALAGGVAVMATPDGFVAFSRQRGLAPDGRCKSFADAADGTGWSEGVGVLVLERLSDAQREGHPILALVRGSAINQDGASNGLTAPSGLAQQRVIRQALANAGVSAEGVQAVEGHGTGTTLGDPIEAQALLATYGQQRSPADPLWLGSIKSNIGHPQAASGVAGVIKMAMALQHRTLPKTLHLDSPSTQVDWSKGAVALLSEQVPWEAQSGPRRAGVSSFGASGTNAHLILEEAPPGQVSPLGGMDLGEGDDCDRDLGGDDGDCGDGDCSDRDRRDRDRRDRDDGGESRNERLAPFREAVLAADGDACANGASAPGMVALAVSAKQESALRAQARLLFDRVDGDPNLRPLDVAYSLAAGRSSFERRAVVLAGGREDLAMGLRSLARGEPDPMVVEGTFQKLNTRIAFLFTGQGAQRVGMGSELYARFAVFRDALDEVCGYMDEHLRRSLREVMFGGEGAGALIPRGSDAARVRDEQGSAPGLLDRTAFTQPALFALEVALFRLIASFGLEPDYLIGHSVGELAAAHVAGVLSLEDACRLVAARGRLMDALPPGGAMVAVQATEQEALGSLVGAEQEVSLAAVNGPDSVVLSGEQSAVERLADSWAARGRKTRRLQVSHAFHSARMDPMLAELAEVARGISFTRAAIPIVSNVTGAPIGDELCDADYWVAHARNTVRFAEGVQALAAERVNTFVEIGPDGVLSAMAHACLSAADDDDGAGVASREDRALHGVSVPASTSAGALVVPVLREERTDEQALLGALAELWVRGVAVDWAATLRDEQPRRVALPTYPFQRRRYWLESGMSGAKSACALGQSPVAHPLLGAMAPLADGGGWLFTGRISLDTHSWLADHAALGVVVLPGTAFLELALHVGGQIGSETVRALTLHTPLVLPEQGAVALQVSVRAPDASGTRTLTVHSRREESGSYEDPSVRRWTHHATGVLTPTAQVSMSEHAQPLGGAWPPSGARSIELDSLSERSLAQGFEDGPAFGVLRAAWCEDGQLWAEVALSEDQSSQAGSFGLHPALLHAALQAASVELHPHRSATASESGTARSGVRLPFAFQEAILHATGARSLRVRIRPNTDDTFSLSAWDEAGGLVASMDAFATRPVAEADLVGLRGAGDSLFCLDWTAIRCDPPMPTRSSVGSEWVLLGCEDSPLAKALRGIGSCIATYPDVSALADAVQAGLELPDTVLLDVTADAQDAVDIAAHRVLGEVLGTIQAWLAEAGLTSARLVVISRNAVAARSADSVDGLASAAVWGLVRSAQSENPGCLTLLDVDGEESSWRALSPSLAAAIASDEPQLAIREGDWLVPRLTAAARTRGAALAHADEHRFDPGRSVLITGGTGGLGALLARHLVVDHGVRSLMLASRRGAETPGASQLQSELEAHGARVAIADCDVADRGQLAALIESTPSAYPLGAVIHAAAAIEDGVIASLTPERLSRVLAPKLDGAWHLHDLTRELELSAFVLFSSAAGTLGGPGQGNYAAANVFLDALAAHRRARGLPGTSLAWGPWAQPTELTSALSEADLTRMTRFGLSALSREEGLALFDVAAGVNEPLMLAARLDGAALRAQAAAGLLAAPLRALVRVPLRRSEHNSLAQRLGGMLEQERRAAVLEAVRRETAIVLGQPAPETIDAELTFKELGFNSLTAVELRNRLAPVSGLRLPATLIFDYPTPGALSDHLLRQISPTDDAEEDDDERIRQVVSSIPVARLRQAGLTEILLRLAEAEGESSQEQGDEAIELIESMDIDGLVQRALQEPVAQESIR